MRRLIVAALLLFAAAQASATTFVSDGQTCAKGRVLVGAAPGVDVAREAGGKARALGAGNHAVEVPAGTEQAAIARLKGRFKFAELDCLSPPAYTPNDPYFGSAWHLGKIRAPQAWDVARGVGIVVAIIDTGTDCTHPDLACVPGWNFYDGNANAADVTGHGSATAGAAAAVLSNATGVSGVAGGALIMPLRVSAPDGLGYWSMMAQAIAYASANGARVANLSYENMLLSSSIKAAAQAMKDAGGLVVVAAGNAGTDPGFTPTTSMIAVSATDTNDARASWSNQGAWVSLAAPGVSIWTTQRGGSYGQWLGTSFSSPIVAGVAALMMASNPALSSSEVESMLFASAVDLGAAGRDASFGWGRVDAAAAVAMAAGLPPPSPPPPPPPSDDATPPTVAIGAPGGTNVSGTTTVYASAKDNKPLTGITMTLFIDGAQVASTVGTGKVQFYWNTRTYALGPHTITATATDAAGNTSSVTKAVNKPY
jgi:thermitase